MPMIGALVADLLLEQHRRTGRPTDQKRFWEGDWDRFSDRGKVLLSSVPEQMERISPDRFASPFLAIRRAASQEEEYGLRERRESLYLALKEAGSGKGKREIEAAFRAREYDDDEEGEPPERSPEIEEGWRAFASKTSFRSVVEQSCCYYRDSDLPVYIAAAFASAYYGVPEELKGRLVKVLPESALKEEWFLSDTGERYRHLTRYLRYFSSYEYGEDSFAIDFLTEDKIPLTERIARLEAEYTATYEEEQSRLEGLRGEEYRNARQPGLPPWEYVLVDLTTSLRRILARGMAGKVIQKIEINSHSYFGGGINYSLVWDKTGATLTLEEGPGLMIETVRQRQFSPEEAEALRKRISALPLYEWRGRYVAEDVCDGDCWEGSLHYTDGTFRTFSGYCSRPAGYEKLLDIFHKLLLPKKNSTADCPVYH